MKKLLVCLLLLCTSPLFASDAVVTWQASPGASNYVVHLGIASGAYTVATPPVVVLTHTYPDASMFQNVRNYLAITASNAAGSSAFSQEISGFPRSTIATSTVTNMGTFMQMVVTGANFGDGLLASNINFVGMTVLSVIRTNANTLTIQYTVDSGFQDQPTDLVISNTWSGSAGFVDSVPSAVFIVPGVVPPPPVVESIN